jgi:hypothetical protein
MHGTAPLVARVVSDCFGQLLYIFLIAFDQWQLLRKSHVLAVCMYSRCFKYKLLHVMLMSVAAGVAVVSCSGVVGVSCQLLVILQQTLLLSVAEGFAGVSGSWYGWYQLQKVLLISVAADVAGISCNMRCWYQLKQMLLCQLQPNCSRCCMCQLQLVLMVSVTAGVNGRSCS